MSSIAKPRLWLLSVAAVAALWTALGVVSVTAAPRSRPARPATVQPSGPAEMPDPALDALIHRFALAAGRGR